MSAIGVGEGYFREEKTKDLTKALYGQKFPSQREKLSTMPSYMFSMKEYFLEVFDAKKRRLTGILQEEDILKVIYGETF